MKKFALIIGIILVLCGISLVLFSNIDGDVKEVNEEPKTKEEVKNIIKLTVDGYDLIVGDAFDATKISEEASISHIPSCAFEGEDVVYTYANLEVTTNEDKIYSLYFIDDSIQTNEGLILSDDVTKMEELYGKEYTKENEQIYVYKYDNANLKITTNDNTITGIEYILVK